jgi:hygromycin-B 7''-O-kinase
VRDIAPGDISAQKLGAKSVGRIANLTYLPQKIERIPGDQYVPLPDLQNLDEYRAIYHEEALWRPAIDEIRRRHGLADEPCQRVPVGTHLVYYAGPYHVIKLFVPLFESDFVAETLVAKRVEGKLGVTTPRIVHQGEITGWRYLVMTRVPGRQLGEVWHGISAENRHAIARQVGQLIAQVRSISVVGLNELAIDWAAFVARQVATAAERQRGGGVPEDLLAQVPAFLESTVVHLLQGFEPVLLLADITDENVLLSKAGGSWQVVSYVDFGDAVIGHPDYELVTPGLELARGDGQLLRALLRDAGYAESELNKELRRRLMAFTLLHRFVQLEDVVKMVPQARGDTVLEELAQVLWPVC